MGRSLYPYGDFRVIKILTSTCHCSRDQALGPCIPVLQPSAVRDEGGRQREERLRGGEDEWNLESPVREEVLVSEES